jgi:toxin YoeB
MIYIIELTVTAAKDISALKKHEPQAYKKLEKLLAELVEHPTTGTGKPEPLRGARTGQWSRRITQKHRLIYEIHEEKITVLVLSTYGHYNDK